MFIILIGVPIEKQTVLCNNGWKGTLKNEDDLSKYNFNEKSKVTLMGTAESVPLLQRIKSLKINNNK